MCQKSPETEDLYHISVITGDRVVCQGCFNLIKKDEKYIFLQRLQEYICEDCWELLIRRLFK
jgi:hypothetical protein